MARKIKVHRIDMEDGREEVTEESIEEAQRIMDICLKLNFVILNTKTREIIREIGPHDDEITVYFQAIIGGG
ncbi:hypothetical protein ACFLU4_08610 [Chloroflexota bacterium]